MDDMNSSKQAHPESPAIVGMLRRHLTSEWTRKKTPQGFNKALIKTRSLPKDATARIFLDAGSLAWMSYFLATNLDGQHYPGKKAEQMLIRHLDQLSVPDRTSIATEIAQTLPHDTARVAIAKIASRFG